jgi:uncharacterized protein (TIRG00374 family)
MKISWRGLIGLALTVGLLWWAFHDVDWATLWGHVRTADPFLVALAVVTGTMMFPLRAIRWRPILDPVAPKLPYGLLWRATAIGMMANNVLPARLGELVRAYSLSRQSTVPFSAAFASLVVDRVFDAVVVLLLLVSAMLDPRFPTGISATTYAGTGIILVMVAGIGLYSIVFFPDRLIRVFEMFARRVAPRFEERGRVLLRSFADGLSILRQPRRFFVVFMWTVLHWLVQALAFWIMFRAIGITAPFTGAIFVMGLIVVGVAAPSTPGFFGPFEAASVAGLKLYGVNETLAGAWALSYHILSLIPITLFGLYYLGKTGLQLGELREIKR